MATRRLSQLIPLVLGFLLYFSTDVKGRQCSLPDSVPNGQLVFGPDYTYDDYLSSDPDKSKPGDSISIVCDYDFKLSSGGSGEATCKVTGNWDPPLSTCVPEGLLSTAPPSQCSIPLVSSGKVTKDGRLLHTGLQVSSPVFVEITCTNGFVIRGDSLLTCQLDGNWQGRIPLCLPAATPSGDTKCRVPRIEKSRIKLQHTDVNEGDEINYGQELSIGCKPGYTRDGERYITCLSNGSWSEAIPVCSNSFLTAAPTDCKLPSIPNGKYHIASDTGTDGYAYDSAYDNTYNYGSPPNGNTIPQELQLGGSIEVKCDDGYEMQGSKQVNCEFDGSLSHVPMCILPPGPGRIDKCIVPLIPEGRIKRLHDNINPGTAVDIGTIIDISCNVGNDREGDDVLTCLGNGTWNHPTPKCKPKIINAFEPCHLPMITDGGYGEAPTASSPQTDSTAGADHGDDYGGGGGDNYGDGDYGGGGGEDIIYRGSNTTVFCNQGYKLVGPTIVNCFENVTHSDIPRCERVVCAVKPMQHGSLKVKGIVAPAEVEFNDTLFASCDEGFHLIGADRLTCGEGQEFDEDFPKCINETDFCTIPTIENGRPSLLRPGLNMMIRETVKIVCNKGYKLVSAENKMKCGVDGDWLPRVPQCLIARCIVDMKVPDGKIMVNGSLAPSSVVYGVNITVVCDDEFRLIGNQNNAQCREDERFSQKLPRCVPEDIHSCGVARMRDNNTIILTNSTRIKSGDTVGMACAHGYVAENKYDGGQLNCNEGVWRQKMPVCIIDNKCTLPNITHGHIERPVVRKSKENSLEVGEHAVVKCKDGYSLDGEKRLECIGVEKYGSKFPVCESVVQSMCRVPEVGFGKVMAENGRAELRRFVPHYTRIFVQCLSDGELVTERNHSKCGLNGAWDQELYKCKVSPEPVSVPNKGYQSDTSDRNTYIAVGAVVFLLVIISLIAAVIIHRRRKRRREEMTTVFDNNIDNMVYLTALETKDLSGVENGRSNQGMRLQDDDYMPPNNLNGGPFDDDVVMRRPQAGSHVRDSVPADFEDGRPISIVTFKPAYNGRESKRDKASEECGLIY